MTSNEATSQLILSEADLRAVAAYAATCAEDALAIFERAHPDDPRPREAIEAARTFARGDKRSQLQRTAAWAALRAAQDANDPAAEQAARAAMAAAGAAYLHPLASASQVKHLLGAAAHAARAAELAASNDPTIGTRCIVTAAERASPEVIDVLTRYPAAPAGGGRVGGLTRELDAALRARRA